LGRWPEIARSNLFGFNSRTQLEEGLMTAWRLWEIKKAVEAEVDSPRHRQRPKPDLKSSVKSFLRPNYYEDEAIEEFVSILPASWCFHMDARGAEEILDLPVMEMCHDWVPEGNPRWKYYRRRKISNWKHSASIRNDPLFVHMLYDYDLNRRRR